MRALTTISFTLVALMGFTALTAAAPAPSVVGIWTGIVQEDYCPYQTCRPVNLRLFLHVTADSAGRLRATLDSPTQNVMGSPTENVVLKGNSFSFDYPAGQAVYRATISADANTLDGTWNKETNRQLVFTRVPRANGVVGLWAGVMGAALYG